MIKIITGNFCASVVRDGRIQVVKQGQPFDFDAEEIADIVRVHGDGSLRDPRNESSAAEEVVAETPVAPKAPTKTTKVKGNPEL